MSNQMRPPGKTTIAPDVLVTIARLTTLSVPGVHSLALVPGGVNLFKRGDNDGVRIVVENDTVYADLYVVLCRDVPAKDIAHTVQQKVARAISEMVGMEVGRVNIHVEDINFGSECDKPSS